MRVITFSCQKNIFVYEDGCGFLPMSPFKSHSDIESAKKYMINDRKIKNPKIEIHKSKS